MNLNLKSFSDGFGGKFHRAMETKDHVYYVDYNQGDDNGSTKMFNKKTGKLVSDNIFATNDLFEVIQNKTYTKISPTLKKNSDAYLSEN